MLNRRRAAMKDDKDQTPKKAPTAADKKQQKKERNKRYNRELERLQTELAHLQAWVKDTQARVIIVFEGRDAAGKGGIIKRLTERVSPRVFRIAALPPPSDREKSQMYFQRYFAHFPAGGEIVIFDRSWYNRPGVERVMGFCTEEEAQNFLSFAPIMERTVVKSGIILLKYFVDVGEKEQDKRFHQRVHDPLRQWKLSPMDLESYRKWWDYTAAYDEMISKTDSEWAPWWIVPSNDKKAARINCLSHILASLPYERIDFEKPKFDKRQKRPKDFVEDLRARNVVPDIF
jgi:polyphosphate kinase 2